MDSYAIARETSPDAGAVPPDRQLPFRAAAPRSRPARNPIGTAGDRAGPNGARALRPSQVPVAGAAGMLAAIGRRQGQPLDPQTRSDMEKRLRGNFAGVRIHTGEAAAQLALAIDARAFTVGEEIGFGAGAYAPATSEGRRLLAHELVHVQQQRRGPVAGSPRGGPAVSDPGDDFERDARAVADRAVTDPAGPAGDARGAAHPVAGVTQGMVVQRQEAPSAPSPDVDPGSQARYELELAGIDAREAAKKSDLLRDKLDNVMRAAYRTEKKSLISDVAEAIGTVVDVGVDLHELARGISESLAERRGIELAPVSKLTEALIYFNKGIAAFNLVLTLTDSDERATAAEEGMREVTVAAEAFDALSTLAGASAQIGLYANLYLVPLTKAILSLLSKVTDLLHDENVVAEAALGGPLLYPGAEPGEFRGEEELHQFMIALMHARADQLPQLPPMPDSVKVYLFKHHEQIEAGARTSTVVEEEMPTTGWFSRELDTPRAVEWLWVRRRQVWAMLYGSMKVPQGSANPGSQKQN